MPPLRTSLNIWSHLELGYHIVVPTNCELKRNGSLVMGAGLARAIAEKFPTAPGVFGWFLKEHGPGVYDAKCSYHDGSSVGSLIAFPTKVLWREPAIWEVVRRSLVQLVALADKRSLSNIFVPKVGCGLGGLQWGQVSETFDELLDERFSVPMKGNG